MRLLFRISVLFVLGQLLYKTVTQRCGSEISIFGWMLRGHIYSTMLADLPHTCVQVCREDDRCQSFNWVISLLKCEFSNRTKEARPEDFISDPDRFYYKRDRNRVPLGSIPELPAETCLEIKMSEGHAISRKYWFSSIQTCTSVLAYCDMKTEAFMGSLILATNQSYLHYFNNFLAPAVGNNSHWLLCWRATLHGFNASQFHSRCDGKNHTVTIVKNSSYVFGGYTDIPWGSREGYGYTLNAFVFSISNKEELDPFKINNLEWPSYAIWSSSRCGPGFGVEQIIILLKEDGTSLARLGIDYPAPAGVQDPNTILAGSKYFLPDEVEVFYLNPTP